MNIIALKILSILAVMVFMIVLISNSYAVETNIKVGKYNVGINYFPLVACAHWHTGNYNNFRVVNSKEYLQISKDFFSLDIKALVSKLEKVKQTRGLADSEKVFCNEVMALDKRVFKAVPSKNGTRPTRDAATAKIKLKYRVKDTVRCSGKMIKKYRDNDNWYRVDQITSQVINVATRCGWY